jgi:hypothetical protein
MDSLYLYLNTTGRTTKHKRHNDSYKETTKLTFHTRLVNLTHVKFSNHQINTLNLGFDYAIEINPR